MSRPTPSPLAMETDPEDSDDIAEVPRALPQEAQEAASSQDAASSVCTHIEAYMIFSGDRLGLAGVGAGANWGKIPRNWTAGQLKATTTWMRILTPMRSPGDPIVIDVNYTHLPHGWAPKQVWFAKRKRDHIGEMRSLVHNCFTQYTADNTELLPALGNDSPAQYNAEWILLSNSVVQILVENILQADIDLNEVDTPRTPSMQDNDSA